MKQFRPERAGKQDGAVMRSLTDGRAEMVALAREEQRQLLAALRGEHPYCYDGERNEPLAHQCKLMRDLYMDVARGYRND